MLRRRRVKADHLTILKVQRSFLVNRISLNGEQLYTTLRTKGVIGLHDVEEFQKGGVLQYTQVGRLLDFLGRRPLEDYNKFLECLEETGQQFIVRTLNVATVLTEPTPSDTQPIDPSPPTRPYACYVMLMLVFGSVLAISIYIGYPKMTNNQEGIKPTIEKITESPLKPLSVKKTFVIPNDEQIRELSKQYQFDNPGGLLGKAHKTGLITYWDRRFSYDLEYGWYRRRQAWECTVKDIETGIEFGNNRDFDSSEEALADALSQVYLKLYQHYQK